MSAGEFWKGKVPMAAEELKENLADLARGASTALNGVSDAVGLTPKVEENPWGMVLAALGVGYVLGGGLFTSTTARVLKLGARVAAIPVVRDKLIDVAEAAVDGLLGNTQPEKEEP